MLAALIAVLIAVPQTSPSDGIPFASLLQINGGSNSSDSWNDLKAHADDPLDNEPDHASKPEPTLVGNHDDMDDTIILARALVWVRDPSINAGCFSQSPNNNYAEDVQVYVQRLYGTEDDPDDEGNPPGSDGLRAKRSIFCYVSAFQIIWAEEGRNGSGSITNAEYDAFIAWIGKEDVGAVDGTGLLDNQWYDGRTLKEAHETVPTNVGLFAGASRLACEMIRVSDGGTDSTIPEIRNIFRAYCGNTSVHPRYNAGTNPQPFTFDRGQGETHWQHTNVVNDWVAINPVNSAFYAMPNPPATVGSGCLNEEMRRWDYPSDHSNYYNRVQTGFEFPSESYCFEALEAMSAQMLMLGRCGYTPWTVQSNAAERAIDWIWDYTDLQDADEEIDKDNYWVMVLAEDKYDREGDWTSILDLTDHKPGRAMCGIEWLIGQ